MFIVWDKVPSNDESINCIKATSSLSAPITICPLPCDFVVPLIKKQRLFSHMTPLTNRMLIVVTHTEA